MSRAISLLMAFIIVFSNYTFCSATGVDDSETTAIAEKVYEEACKVWDEAYTDEQVLISEGSLKPEDALTNMVEGNFVEKTKKILEKYRPFNNNPPKVLSHEEFEKAKEGKQVCYRGITESVNSKFTLEEKTEHLLSGKFNNGSQGSGVFSSFIKSAKDLKVGQYTELTAENYAYRSILDAPVKGRLFTFFYDPETTVIVGNLDNVINKYTELYPEYDVTKVEIKIAQEDNKGLFLMLGNWYFSAYRNFAHLLGADVCLPDNDNPQIFSTGVLTFDSEYEDTDFNAMYPFSDEAIIEDKDSLYEEISEIVVDKEDGETKYYSKHPHFMGSSKLMDTNLFELVAFGKYRGTQWRYNEEGNPEIVRLVINGI